MLIIDKNVKFEINLPKEKIVCQSQRIKMLFYNLITNGIKFNNSKLRTINIDFKNRGKEWYFTISDNGIGIEQKHENQIFKPFKRLNTRDKFPGNGIGLSMCKRIANLHGGQIWFTKNQLSGTIFHFTILKNTALNKT